MNSNIENLIIEESLLLSNIIDKSMKILQDKFDRMNIKVNNYDDKLTSSGNDIIIKCQSLNSSSPMLNSLSLSSTQLMNEDDETTNKDENDNDNENETNEETIEYDNEETIEDDNDNETNEETNNTFEEDTIKMIDEMVDNVRNQNGGFSKYKYKYMNNSNFNDNTNNLNYCGLFKQDKIDKTKVNLNNY